MTSQFSRAMKLGKKEASHPCPAGSIRHETTKVLLFQWSGTDIFVNSNCAGIPSRAAGAVRKRTRFPCDSVLGRFLHHPPDPRTFHLTQLDTSPHLHPDSREPPLHRASPISASISRLSLHRHIDTPRRARQPSAQHDDLCVFAVSKPVTAQLRYNYSRVKVLPTVQPTNLPPASSPTRSTSTTTQSQMPRRAPSPPSLSRPSLLKLGARLRYPAYRVRRMSLSACSSGPRLPKSNSPQLVQEC
jgi:hypothetical protein